MKIVRLEAWVLRVEVQYPRVSQPSAVPIVMVELEVDEGLVGHAACYYPTAAVVRDILRHDIADVVLGMDASRPETVAHAIRTGLRQQLGLSVWAASLVDIALWDIRGKAADLPVWKLLGGARPRVPTYVTYGLPRYSDDDLVDVANDLVASGHDKLKIIVGAGSEPSGELLGDPLRAYTEADIRRDVARVEAVREAVGPGVALMIDANKNLALPAAHRLATLVEPLDITWFEDPIRRADPNLLAELRRSTSIPIAVGGMGVFDPLSMRTHLAAGAVDILQPNVRDVGGYTGALKAAHLAEAFGIPLGMGGNWPHLNVHLHAGVPNGGWVEYHWQGWKVAEQLFEGVGAPSGGWVDAPTRPGVGVPLRDGVIEEFAWTKGDLR